ncbi:L-asparaginase [Chitinophaga skermanii]|uniref:L-asparaginase n=1 Tax=Chitinophaga skermanii TaxID=331697 RepID=A0A327QDA6_9BACT|nr:type II asparaginase [Chitinophaga skermanii]RAJ01612.1 L-asparaginase [Chitinophaga skermanii]
MKRTLLFRWALPVLFSVAILSQFAPNTAHAQKRKKTKVEDVPTPQTVKRQHNPNLPNVIILATGGTIAGAGESAVGTAYTAGQLPIESLLAAVPEASKVANITGEQVAQVGSQAMNDTVWLKLAKRINELAKRSDVHGFVITHGTDTQEETALFLQLTVKTDKPVVLVGAMRSATAISADGPKNLYDAIVTAASNTSKGKGVVVCMNDNLYSARDVEKMNTTNVDAFKAPNAGPVGFVLDGKVAWYNMPLRKHTLDAEFDITNVTELPKVDIVYGYSNLDPAAFNAFVNSGSKGIVIAGVGNGNLYPALEAPIKAATAKGIAVVRSSRVGSGRVTLDAETDDKGLGTVASDEFNPQKARVLLQLALLKTNNQQAIQEMFFRY